MAELGSKAALQSVALSAHRTICFTAAIAGNLSADRRWGTSKQLRNRAITEPGNEAAGYFLAFQLAQGTCFAQPHAWRYAALRKQNAKNRSRVLAKGAASRRAHSRFTALIRQCGRQRWSITADHWQTLGPSQEFDNREVLPSRR